MTPWRWVEHNGECVLADFKQGRWRWVEHNGSRVLYEAAYREVLHPRGRGGRWIPKGTKLRVQYAGGEQHTWEVLRPTKGRAGYDVRDENGRLYSADKETLHKLATAQGVQPVAPKPKAAPAREPNVPEPHEGDWPVAQAFQRARLDKGITDPAEGPKAERAMDAAQRYAKRVFESHTDATGQKYLQAYEEAAYADLNAQLRSGKVVPSRMVGGSWGRGIGRVKTGQMIQTLDAAIGNSVAKQDVIAYRGAPKSAFADLKVGDEFTDPGYGSTSLRRVVAAQTALDVAPSERAVAEIRIPKGAHAFAYDEGMTRIDPLPESEVLLPRDTRYRVASANPLVLEVVQAQDRS